MSAFDLLDNPFAVVGVSVNADRARIGEAIDDALFDDDSPGRQRQLDNARQSLFAPRSRLEAELGFLPGSDDETVTEVLVALRKHEAARTADNLAGIDRVNYLAHRCATENSSAKARTAKALIYAYDDIAFERLITTVSAARQRSGFGEVDGESARSAFTKLRERHAEAALDGLLAGSQGPEAVSELAKELARAPSGRREFIALVINRYEARKGGEIEQIAEDVRARLEKLDGAHRVSDIAAFKDALLEWDRLAQPLQVADNARGIDEPHSRDLFGSIREHCLDLANNKSRYALALAILEIGKPVFIELPDASATIDKDIHDLKDLLRGERLEAALSPLKSLVDTASSNLAKLGRELRHARISHQHKEIMAALDEAVSSGDLETATIAVAMIRGLAIKLANDAEDNVGALAITASLLQRRGRLPSETAAQLQQDHVALARNISFANMMDALKSGKLNHAKSLANSLLADASGEEAGAIKNILHLISERQKKSRNGWIWTAVILGGIVAAIALSEKKSGGISNYDPPYQYNNTSASEDVENILANAEEYSEETILENQTQNEIYPEYDEISTEENRPPLYSIGATFDRSQVRYCMMQKARLEAANDISARPTEYQIQQFNSTVDDYNSRCSNFRYHNDDMTAVQQEVNENASRLRSEGEALVSGGY